MQMMLVVAAVVFALPSFAQGRSADESALRAQVTSFEAAINKRDMVALGALYAQDADVIVADGPVVVGRAAILAATRSDWGTGSSATRRIRLSVTGIRFLGPDVAIVSTRAQFNEGPVTEDRGTWIGVRQSGKWLIAALRVLPAARQ